MQLTSGDAAHFPSLKNVCTTQHVTDMKGFKDKITGLLREFEQHFQIFGELEKDFKVFSSPFTVNPSDLPIYIQLEIIYLHCDLDLYVGQICGSWLGHILSDSLARLLRLDRTHCKTVVHVWNHISL